MSTPNYVIELMPIDALIYHANALQNERKELERENAELKRIIAESKDYIKIAHLIGSIFCHGNFTAETYNERELEKLLIKVGRFYQSTDEVVEASKSIIE